jgi:hypothetical protein
MGVNIDLEKPNAQKNAMVALGCKFLKQNVSQNIRERRGCTELK